MSILPHGKQWHAHTGQRARLRNLQHEDTRMSANNNRPVAFPAPASTPIVGQPFTLLSILIPVSAAITCNCGQSGDTRINTTINIVLSAGATCPACHRVWNVAFNPTTNKLEFTMALPGTVNPGTAE
jgi:hypothetical protein